MYLNFFKMKMQPFNVTPDPEFLFLSSSHKEALASVIYGIKQKKGFIAIIGEVGMGKTTVIRSYLDRIDRKLLTPIYLFNANITFAGLLKTVFNSLSLDCPSDVPFDMVTRLHEYLISEYRNGRTVVLIIDEAQNMPIQTLENLRMLSNLETTKDKLLQIVFSGQPEFEELLARKELRQLAQRISVKATIIPLSNDEGLSYIRHRLAKAGDEEGKSFTDSAMRLIVRQAKGIPRVINMLCDNCLISAYGLKQKSVNNSTVKEIIADSRSSRPPKFGWGYTLAASLMAVIIVGGIYVVAQPSIRSTPPSVPTAATAIETVATARPAVETVSVAVDPSPATAKDENPATVSRLVKKGDTLAKLMVDIYGYADKADFKLVKQSNPAIKDVDRINVGEKIIFPVVNR